MKTNLLKYVTPNKITFLYVFYGAKTSIKSWPVGVEGALYMGDAWEGSLFGRGHAAILHWRALGIDGGRQAGVRYWASFLSMDEATDIENCIAQFRNR